MKILSIKIKDSCQIFNLVAVEMFYLTHSEHLNFSGREQFITILKCIPNMSIFMFFTTVLFIQILIVQLNDFARQLNRVLASKTPCFPSSGDS